MTKTIAANYIDNKTLAYVSGLFDAEVSFHINNNVNDYSLRLDWLKIDREILQYVSDIFGGTVTSVKLQPKQRYPVWHWSLGAIATYKVLKDIYPFLHIKQKPAAICLEFYQRYSDSINAGSKEVIGKAYQSLLQEYQRKPGSSQKSAEALKNNREKTKTTTVKPEFQGKMHSVIPEIELSVTDTAYIAGLLDADSSFLISRLYNRNSYLLEVKYRKYDYLVLEYLATIFGGRVRRAPLSSNNQIQPWLWLVGSQNAYRLIKHIYPYLRVKKRTAEICMEFFEQYWTGSFGKPISPKRQLIGEKYHAMLKGHLTKSMPHKKKIEIISDISL